MKNFNFMAVFLYIFFVIFSNPALPQSSILENQKLASQKGDDDRSIQDWISAFYHYLNQGNFEQAIKEAERWEKRSEGLDDQNSRALYLKSSALYILKRHDEVIPILEKITSLYLNSKSEEAVFIARKSMIDKAANFIIMRNLEKAMNAYDILYPHIVKSPETKYIEMTAKTLSGKGLIRTMQGNYPAAIPLYSGVIVILQNKNIPQADDTLSDAFLNLGIAFRENGETDLSIKTWMAGANRLQKSNNLKVIFNISQMMMRTAGSQEEKNNKELAINIYSDIIKYFSKFDTPEIQFNVEQAQRRLSKLTQ
jgi:tetratricopeptide (TPR) repeat protein